MTHQSLNVSPEEAGITLAALVRKNLTGQSWSQVRRLIAARNVKVGGDLCLDPARRLKEGESVEILARPIPQAHADDAVVIRHLDEHIVVVEKLAGMNTVRHPTERDWPERRKALSPTLQDLVLKSIAKGPASGAGKRPGRAPLARPLRVVHRIDKETSGLVVFARTVAAERGLGKQFHAHSVHRRYLAVVPGFLPAQRIESYLARNRGDGRRGSTHVASAGKHAVTHIEVVERLPRYTLLACRLETGRTHQIRIHLAEAGHPICGEKVYNRPYPPSPLGGEGQGVRGEKPDHSRAPRLALHAAELGFIHPVTGEALRWEMPLPADMQALLDRLRKQPAPHSDDH